MGSFLFGRAWIPIGFLGRFYRGFWKLADLFLRDLGRFLHTEQKAGSQLNLYFSFGILEYVFSDVGPVHSVSKQTLFEQFIMLVRPIKALLGIEVNMVEGSVFIADFRTRQSLSHEQSILVVVDRLGAFIHFLIWILLI